MNKQTETKRHQPLPALHPCRLYGSNVCGEGGEYESLTLDCPLFTHGSIVLDAWEAVSVSADSMAPVALLHPTAFHVQPKAGAPEPRHAAVIEVRAQAARPGGCCTPRPGGCCTPRGGTRARKAGWASRSLPLPAHLREPGRAWPQVPADYEPRPEPAPQLPDVPPGLQASTSACVSAAAGCRYAYACAEVRTCADVDGASALGTQLALAAALRAVQAALPAAGLTFRDSLFVHLYVPSMDHFAAANAAYAAYLPAVNPPARATVQLAAGAGLALAVEVMFARWGAPWRSPPAPPLRSWPAQWPRPQRPPRRHLTPPAPCAAQARGRQAHSPRAEHLELGAVVHRAL